MDKSFQKRRKGTNGTKGLRGFGCGGFGFWGRLRLVTSSPMSREFTEEFGNISRCGEKNIRKRQFKTVPDSINNNRIIFHTAIDLISACTYGDIRGFNASEVTKSTGRPIASASSR